MKKIIFLAVLSVLLFGCGKVDESINETNHTDVGQTDMNEGVSEESVIEEAAEEIPSELPDIEIVDILWGTMNPKLGESDKLTIKIKNSGDASIGTFEYKIIVYKDNEVWDEEISQYNETLNPGDEAKIKKSYTFTKVGEYKADIYFDPDKKIQEKNKVNNIWQSYTINAKEEAIDDSEEEPDDEDTVVIEGKCSDTDGGKDYETKGRCTDGGSFQYGMNDYCKDKYTLVELYCDEATDKCKFDDDYECGCQDGACQYIISS